MASTPDTESAVAPVGGDRPARHPALGITVFVVTVVTYLFIPALVLGAQIPDGLISFAGEAAVILVPLIVFGILAAIAIFAAVTRRGRGWAIAALVIAVANDYSPVHDAISELVWVAFG